MLSLVRDIEHALALLRAGRLRVRIPPLAGLFRKIPGAMFHATPEVFIQTGGATDFECPGRSFRLKTWEACVMPAGVPHVETPIDLKTPYGILVCMQARDGLLVHRAAASEQRVITATRAEHLSTSRGRGAFRYLEDMTSSVPEKHRKGYENSLLEAFFITTLGELQRPSAKVESRSPLVAEAEKLVRALLADPELSVAGLAAILGCSADYLSRKFHSEKGQTLTTWIARERVALARDLLPDPKRSVAEVAWMCGFTAASYFIRVFRQQTGLTPRAWRSSAPSLG
jgi:AraC-like DNA-binding protein